MVFFFIKIFGWYFIIVVTFYQQFISITNEELTLKFNIL